MKYFLYGLITLFMGLTVYGVIVSEATDAVFAFPAIILILAVFFGRRADRVKQKVEQQPTESINTERLRWWQSPLPYLVLLAAGFFALMSTV